MISTVVQRRGMKKIQTRLQSSFKKEKIAATQWLSMKKMQKGSRVCVKQNSTDMMKVFDQDDSDKQVNGLTASKTTQRQCGWCEMTMWLTFVGINGTFFIEKIMFP